MAPVPAPVPLPATGVLPGAAIPQFRATVWRKVEGGTLDEPLDSRAPRGPTVYIMNSTTCGYCNSYAARMKAVEAAYIPKGVDVVHVYPNRREPDADKVAWHAKMGFRGGQVLDDDAAIAKELVVDKTPTVFVTDARGVILYRGAIDSSTTDPKGAKPWLADALDAVLAGRPVPVTTTEPEG